MNTSIVKTGKAAHFLCFSIIFCFALFLCSGCEKEVSDPAPTAAPSDSSTPYLIIPLTTGKTAPISACSYDLLNTVTTIQIYDSDDYDILRGCFAVMYQYEKIFSRTLESSEVYQINHSSETCFTISDELKELLTVALHYSRLSDGALDVTIAPLSSLWDFTGAEHQSSVPEEELILPALSLVDYRYLSLEGNTLTFLKEGMQLELGAVAKGFIADKIKEYLLGNGIQSAVINLGGNILLVGEKPDGSAFQVGIQKPFEDRDAIVAAISSLKDVSMVSSGIYERYFYDKDGVFYHHILNPFTGYPCDTDLLQVTVISSDSVVGDALSTACFALGLDKGLELIHSLPDVYAVFITTDGTLHFSDGYLETFPTRTN